VVLGFPDGEEVTLVCWEPRTWGFTCYGGGILRCALTALLLKCIWH